MPGLFPLEVLWDKPKADVSDKLREPFSQPQPVFSVEPAQRRRKPRQPWNDDVHDLEVYRATAEERRERTLKHTSQNVKAAQRDLQEGKVRQDLGRPLRSRSEKSGALLRESVMSSEDVDRLIRESHKALYEARKLLEAHGITISSTRGHSIAAGLDLDLVSAEDFAKVIEGGYFRDEGTSSVMKTCGRKLPSFCRLSSVGDHSHLQPEEMNHGGPWFD